MTTVRQERQWTCLKTGETYSVDAGLEDTWLEALNAYDRLYLRSVCEGHVDGTELGSRKSMPILRLSIVPSFSAALQREDHAVEEQVRSLFAASPLFLTADLQHGWSSFIPDDYFIHLDAKRERSSQDMEPWVREWFREAIVFFQQVDSALLSCV